MPFNTFPEMEEDPPPTYYSSTHELGAEQFEVEPSSLSLSQCTQTLIEAWKNILDASFTKEQFMESLETALMQQPAAECTEIFRLGQSIFIILSQVYCNRKNQPEEDSSINHTGRHQLIEEEDSGASQSESETEDIAAEFNTQLRQSISAENQLELQESAQALNLAQANSSENTETPPISQSRNTERAMTCGTPSRENSRLSSPETMDMPSRIKEALEKEPPEESKEHDHEFRALIAQSTEDFILHAHCQIIEFTWYKNTAKVRTALVKSLDGKESEAESLCSKFEWSSGSKWLDLAEQQQKDRKIGAILYAFAAMNFQEWHEVQLQQFEDVSSQTASKLITDELVGPSPADELEKKNWSQRRSNISTLLTRGKKWIKLVKHFGLGILFYWKLAKTRNIRLPFLIEDLENIEAKMAVLHILSKQVKHILTHEVTKQQEFEDDLRNASLDVGFPIPADLIPRNDFVELDYLCQEISKSTTSGRLYIHDYRWHCEFDVAALQRLKENTWLNDELLVACLHLSEKSAFVRIGWSVPIHRDDQPNVPMERPFQRASKAMQAWKDEATNTGNEKTRPTLVYFFPLFQHGNHFTLLEINEKEECIYHYDSMAGDSTDVKNACEREFPDFEFIEQEAIQQIDANSCSLMVIKHAQNRMKGYPATYHIEAPVDSKSLRFEVINLFKEAWNQGALQEIRKKKRNRGQREKKSAKRVRY